MLLVLISQYSQEAYIVLKHNYNYSYIKSKTQSFFKFSTCKNYSYQRLVLRATVAHKVLWTRCYPTLFL